MSQSPPNYMSGVPVKISERYKPPPKISLPQSVCQRLTTGELSVLKLNYNLNLEENVLSRILEWKAVRVKENNDRRERIRSREEFSFKERREFEEKQKKLLTEVYYPSSDEEIEAIEIKSPEQKFSTPQGHFSPPNRFDTILTPTVVPGSILNNKFTPLTCHSSTVNNHLHSSNDLTKINYSDFENDGSPFDNMELKTINDLDILAQVLNSTKLQNISNNREEKIPVITNEIEDDLTDLNNHQQLIEPNSNYQFSTSPNNFNLFQPNQTVFHQPEYASTFNHLNENFVPSVNNHHHSTTIPPVNYPDMSENYYYNQTYAMEYLNYGNQTTTTTKEQNLPQFSIGNNTLMTTAAKSKSKSVPDILKELNDEISNSEMKRTRNNSQSITSPVEEWPNYEFGEKAATEQSNDEVFCKLSLSSQKLAKNISLMGFPLDRVSRVTQQFGSDDKKVSFY